MYNNVDMKIYRHLSFHMEVICERFCIAALFTFWDMRTQDIWNVCLQKPETKEYVQKKFTFQEIEENF